MSPTLTFVEAHIQTFFLNVSYSLCRHNSPFALSTQVGDPLAHRQEGRLHPASSHGLAATTGFVESDCEDQQVDDLELWLLIQAPQGFIDAEFFAVASPELEDALSFFRGFSGVCCAAEQHCRLEITHESVSDFGWSSRQGLPCG